jgi:hypothetical protein
MSFRSMIGLSADPGPARETRADSSYTDALVAAITANAAGDSTAFPTATAALETAAGFVGRSFAGVDVTAPVSLRPALSASTMRLIGRSLIRRGELVLLIRASRGRLALWPCHVGLLARYLAEPVDALVESFGDATLKLGNRGVPFVGLVLATCTVYEIVIVKGADLIATSLRPAAAVLLGVCHRPDPKGRSRRPR